LAVTFHFQVLCNEERPHAVSIRLTAPGILHFEEDLVQVAVKTALGLDPVPVVDEKNIEQAPVGPAQTCVQTQRAGEVVVLHHAQDLKVGTEVDIETGADKSDIRKTGWHTTP